MTRLGHDVSRSGLLSGSGRVAQLVEQRIENPCAGGSSPPLAMFALACLSLLVACGDHCENLCQRTADRLTVCKEDSLSWPDMGARNKADFVNQCWSDWDRENSQLSAPALREALDVCAESGRDLRGDERLTCGEMLALYVLED